MRIGEVLIKSGMQITQTEKYASKVRIAIYSAFP